MPQMGCQFSLFTNTSVQLKVLNLIPLFQLVIIILIQLVSSVGFYFLINNKDYIFHNNDRFMCVYFLLEEYSWTVNILT